MAIVQILLSIALFFIMFTAIDYVSEIDYILAHCHIIGHWDYCGGPPYHFILGIFIF